MSTYADFYNSRNGQSTSSGPVTLVIDQHGDVLERHESMDLDPDEAMVQGIIQARSLSAMSGSIGEAPNMARTGSNEAKDLPQESILLTVDTNWLLSHLVLFEEVARLIPRIEGMKAPMMFIVPAIVIRELDGLKNSSGRITKSGESLSISHLARKAISFILDKLVSRSDLFRGQRTEETMFSKVEAMVQKNDDLVLDCCEFYQHARPQGPSALLSDDKALCAKVTIQGIPALSFRDADHNVETFLSKLHPTLLSHIAELQTFAAGNNMSTSMTDESTLHTPREAFFDLSQLSAAIDATSGNALSPPHLHAYVSTVIATLLVGPVYSTLLSTLANGNEEILGYMLSKSPVFRSSGRNGASPSDPRSWDAIDVLRLVDMNWRTSFAGKPVTRKPRKSGLSNGKGQQTDGEMAEMSNGGLAGSHANVGAIPKQGASLAASKWASSSSSAGSRFSPQRAATRSASSMPSSLDTATAPNNFSPSKFPAILSAIGAQEADLARWSKGRWAMLIDDLDTLLCKTGILDTSEEMTIAEKGVGSWRSIVASW